jgi:hypothetical protein
MSHTPTIFHGHALPATTRQAGPVPSVLITAATAAAAAVVSALLTAAVVSRSPDAAQPAAASLAPATPVQPVSTRTDHDTSVPAASAVFAGKDVPVEEPVPTF